MHGRFTSNLREFAHDYAVKLKYQIEEEQQREKDDDDFRSFSGNTFTWQLKCTEISMKMMIYFAQHITQDASYFICHRPLSNSSVCK